MKQIVKHCKKIKIKIEHIVPVFLLFIILCIAINPFKYSQVAFKGLEVWAKILVPSLLPFFILTKLFASGNFLNDFTAIFAKPMQKMYKCPKESSYIFFMSILSGYPVGAKLVSDLYKSGNLRRSDAIKTLSFSANSGPMFILGSVAIGMFSSKELGIIIYISHILGSLLNGLIYRNYKSKEIDETNPKLNANNQTISFTESINSSVASVLLIGGVICFTFVLIEVITSSVIFKNFIGVFKIIGLNDNLVSAVFSGLFEITKGCLLMSTLPLSFAFSAVICTFIISFGGISTLLQAMAFTKDFIPTKLFIIQKITHAICSCVVCSLIVFLMY